MPKKKKKRPIRKRISRNMNMTNKFIFGDSELRKLQKKNRR